MSFTVNIKYKTHSGLLDPDSSRVKFYNMIYGTINDAIKLEENLIRDEFEELILPSSFILRTKSFHNESYPSSYSKFE